MLTALLSRIVVLVFGTLYPAYASYKTVKHKKVKNYVKWTMYWIVFACFSCAEVFADIFISWFPFYYEAKIIFLWWLVASKGSKFIFLEILYPILNKHEQTIDAYIASFWSKWYDVLYTISSQGAEYVKSVFFEMLQKGQIAVFPTLPQPQGNDEADSSLGVSSKKVHIQVPEEAALNEEDFDILMEEDPDLYNDAVKASSSRAKRNKKLKEYDSESSVDEAKSKKRQQKVAKPKTRTGLRQRKKNED